MRARPQQQQQPPIRLCIRPSPLPPRVGCSFVPPRRVCGATLPGAPGCRARRGGPCVRLLYPPRQWPIFLVRIPPRHAPNPFPYLSRAGTAACASRRHSSWMRRCANAFPNGPARYARRCGFAGAAGLPRGDDGAQRPRVRARECAQPPCAGEGGPPPPPRTHVNTRTHHPHHPHHYHHDYHHPPPPPSTSTTPPPTMLGLTPPLPFVPVRASRRCCKATTSSGRARQR